MASCDALDGVKDGIINEPRKCAFDPASLVCKGGDAPDCLTPKQVETAKAVYGPVKDPGPVPLFIPGWLPGLSLPGAQYSTTSSLSALPMIIFAISSMKIRTGTGASSILLETPR